MKRSKFSLSHNRLFSCDMGKLIPIGLVEVLPGDTIQHATSALVRASPLLSPVYHPCVVRIHHWYVPHRLVWTDWENFITGGPDGLNASVFPTITINSGSGFAVGSLADYLGCPTGVDDLPVSAIPFRGYALIWNNWYRDQDLETALTIDLTDGADTTTNQTLQAVDWEKDYLTSARPWAQKGASVTLPLGSTAPVTGLGFTANTPTTVDVVARETVASPTYPFSVTASNELVVKSDSTGVGDANRPQIYADLSLATAASVNTIREAMALQRYEEARARYGSRYTEYLRYLGVRSSDARLQRPEYLGGGRQTIQFSEVLQSGTNFDANTGVGTLKGHGIGALRSNRYRRFFEEHGYIFSLMSVRPKTIYMDGLPRHWSRTQKDEFWQKEFQHIGQQEVLNKEARWAHATPNGIFGYQDRYDEYRRQESSVSGEFRTSLNFWHLARDFSSDPALNASFVSCVPTERVFASSSSHVLWCTAHHSIQARRLVSKTGTSFLY